MAATCSQEVVCDYRFSSLMFGRIVSLLSEFELFSGEHRLLALTLGHLQISNIGAVVLIVSSLVFLGSFIFVSLNSDNQGMMAWIFAKKED